MVSRRGSDPEQPQRQSRPATTPEGRENQLVNLAVSRAEQQLRDGTASAQVITHYLKLGSTREQLEQERLRRENALLEAKIASIESQKSMEELYIKAISAMRSYSGQDPQDQSEVFDD
jgi:hypothetical protein